MKKVIGLIIVCTIIISGLFIYSKNINSDNLLENNNLIIAALIDGKSGTTFPTTKYYDTTVLCTQNGNKIENNANAIWDGNKWIVSIDGIETGNVRCNVNFVSISIPFSDTIFSLAPSGLSDVAYDGLYRFSGSDVDNYVCLGECNSDNTNLFRIIGITDKSIVNTSLNLSGGELKLIRATRYETSVAWNSISNSDLSFYNTELFSYLNRTNISSIIPNGWDDRVLSLKWYIGDVQSNTNGSMIFNLENQKISDIQFKIGLMYLSDFFYSNVEGGTFNCTTSPYCTSSWMYLSGVSQWTMTRYGNYNSTGNYRAWDIGSNGYVYKNAYTDLNAVSPVFYLKNTVGFTNKGDGTLSSPFVLE